MLCSLAGLIRSAGAEGFLAQSRFDTPGCIILDVRMPGLNGLELQQSLSAADRQLPIVFITGNGDAPMSVRAMKAGAEDFLPKPFDDEELLKAVAQASNTSQREQNERTEVPEIRRRLSTLTPREREVLCHVVCGRLNKQIAADLSIAEKTIKVHRARVMEKWALRRSPGWWAMAARIGIRTPLEAYKIQE